MKTFKQIFVFLILLPIFCAAQQNNNSSAYVWKQYSQANDFMSAGNYEECIMCCENIVESPLLDDASLYKVLDNLGISYINTGHPDKALPYMERACNLTKYTTPYDSYFLSHCYSSVGRYEEAISCRKNFLDYIQYDTTKESQQYYAQALHITAVNYVSLDDYKNAIDFQEKCIDIYTKIGDSNLALKELYYLALYHSMAEEYEISIEILELYNSRVQESKEPDSQIKYAHSLRLMMLNYQDISDYDKAISCGLEAYNIYKKNDFDNSDCLSLLVSLAQTYSLTFSHNEALRFYIEAESLSVKLFGEISNEHIKELCGLSRCYSRINNFSKADSLGLAAKSILNELVEPDPSICIEVLTNLASTHNKARDYDKAENYYNEALDFLKKTNGENSYEYGDLLCELAIVYRNDNDFKKSLLLGNQGLDILRANIKENSPRYSDYLHFYINKALIIASNYDDIGDYNKSLELYNNCLELIERQAKEDNDSQSFILFRLCKHYQLLSDYERALQYGKKALELQKEIHGENNGIYASSLNLLALIYKDMGDFKNALTLEEKAIAITREFCGEKSVEYANSLGNLSLIYSSFGDYEHALKLDKKAIELKKSIFGDSNLDYALALNNLGNDFFHINDYDNALICLEKSYETLKTILGEDYPDVATSLSNLAFLYLNKHDYLKAIELGERSNEIINHFYGENSLHYAHSLYALSLCNRANDNYTKAIDLQIQSKEIIDSILGHEHILNAKGYDNMAMCYSCQGDFDKAIEEEIKSLVIYKKHIINQIGYLSSLSRNGFWSLESYIFDRKLPYYIYYSNRTDLSFLLYNESALFSKGFLLNTERSLRDMLLESNDSSIIKKYSILQLNQNLLAKQHELPINQRTVDVDSLETLIREQERALVDESTIFEKYTRNLNIKWNDVQQKLKSNDLAIEFLSFETRNDSVMYIALTLDKNDSIPKMFTLFEKKQIDSISDNDYYTSNALYNLIWKPLEHELEGKLNVYFSPAGMLHNIGIEYLPIDNNSNIADKFNLIRLSSTRELVIHNETKNPTKAALYGGLLYNIDPEVIQEDNQANNYKPKYAMMMRGLEDSLNVRGDFSQLGYTLREVESIDELLTRDNLNTKLFTKYNGTEESFKSLDGQRVNILHLATHGSYIPEEKAVQKRDENNYRFIRLGDENNTTVIEDQSLTRSFLVMSGGNMLIHGDSIPDGLDDGILTAQEISKIDLRGLDLVVLSACETALGDVTSEGVMGLQRGFKKAGAQTIVMSLWKVADEPTQQFMTEFYRLLTEGNSKRQSFKGAQQYLRKLYPKQQKKPYWSSFIMLD